MTENVLFAFVAGPPFGGLFYSIGGKGLPFFILAGFIFLTFGYYNYVFIDGSHHFVNCLIMNIT